MGKEDYSVRAFLSHAINVCMNLCDNSSNAKAIASDMSARDSMCVTSTCEIGGCVVMSTVLGWLVGSDRRCIS